MSRVDVRKLLRKYFTENEEPFLAYYVKMVENPNLLFQNHWEKLYLPPDLRATFVDIVIMCGWDVKF